MQINPEHETEVVKKELRKNQKDWIVHFNNKNMKMISAPDIYHCKDKEIIASLRNDFKNNYIVTSTQINFKYDLLAEITHDANSKVVEPKTISVKVPEYSGGFEENEDAEKFLQALFNTQDNLATILMTLKELGESKMIRLWTPSQSFRKSNPIRAVRLDYNFLDRFRVGAYSWIDNDYGLSRGVLLDEKRSEGTPKTKKVI